MNLKLYQNESTTLSMLPVCDECNTVIRDVEIDFSKEKVKGFNYAFVRIYPYSCPNCGAKIDGLQMDGEYVTLFMKNIKGH